MGQQNYGNQGDPPYDGQQQGPAPIGRRAPGGQPQQGYDPRQYPSQQQNMGYAPQQPGYDQQYGQQPYDPAYGEPQQPIQPPPSVLARLNLPPWFPRDPTTLGILAAGGLAVSVCLCGFCLLLLLINSPVPEPEQPAAQVSPPVVIPPTTDAGFATADPFAQGNPFTTPTISLPGQVVQPGVTQPVVGGGDASLVGGLLNPYMDASLDGMRQIDLYLLDPATGQYQGRAQILAGSPEMDQFIEALNISNYVTAPDPTCPNHVTLNITRADGSQIPIGLCLKGGVIVRGLPGLGGNDLPMGPYFTDILIPFLTDQYAALLQ